MYHLNELYYRVFYLILSFFLSFIILFYYKIHLLIYLVFPYVNDSQNIVLHSSHYYTILYNLFDIEIKLLFFTYLIYTSYQILNFLCRGLYIVEYKYIKYLFFIYLGFLITISLIYFFYVYPKSINILYRSIFLIYENVNLTYFINIEQIMLLFKNTFFIYIFLISLFFIFNIISINKKTTQLGINYLYTKYSLFRKFLYIFLIFIISIFTNLEFISFLSVITFFIVTNEILFIINLFLKNVIAFINLYEKT